MKYATLIVVLCVCSVVSAVDYVDQEAWYGGPLEESAEGDIEWGQFHHDATHDNAP